MSHQAFQQDSTLKKPGYPKVTKIGRCVHYEDIPLEVCQSVSDVLARVGDKWSILVIYMLSRDSMRFSELKRSIGSISQKVLTTTVRGLKRDGYVSRKVTPSIPPRVDYTLTSLGHDVLVPVTAMAMWAFRCRGEVEAARKHFDARNRTG